MKLFKFSLPHQKSSHVDVFNHSFWKLFMKIINDLDPGLNLPEIIMLFKTPIQVLVCKVGHKMYVCYLDFRCYFEANGEDHIHFRLIQFFKNSIA